MKKSTLKRIKKLRKSQMKVQKKLMKAKAERIWIEENHQIHILNYPYYKIKIFLKHLFKLNNFIYLKYFFYYKFFLHLKVILLKHIK